MSKRSCCRTSFGNERVNGFQTLLRSARHHYQPTFPSIRDKLSWKRSPLVISEILKLFVNTLTAGDKYSRRNMKKFPQQVQTTLSQKEKTFSGFFFAFLKFAGNVEDFEKKASILASLFPKLLNPKEVVTLGLKGLSGERNSVINALTGSQHC